MDDKIFVIKQGEGENPGLFEVCVVCFIIFFKGVSWGGEQEVVGVSTILHFMILYIYNKYITYMYLSSICAATVSYNKYTAIQIFNNQEEKSYFLCHHCLC